MLTLIIFAVVAIFVFLLFYLFAIRPNKKGLTNEAIQKAKIFILKILSVCLVTVYAFRLFSTDVIRQSIALEPIQALAGFSPAGIAFITILRALTNVAVIVAMMSPWYNLKFTKNLMSFFVPAVYIANVCVFRWNILSFVGADEASTLNYRTVQFALECILVLCISAFYIYDKIVQKDFKFSVKQPFLTVAGVVAMMFAVLPLESLSTLFGLPNLVADEFSFFHRILVYFTFLLPVAIYFATKNKPYAVRDFVLTFLSICGFVTFFSLYGTDFSVSNVPLHLCHTAIILMLISFVFKSKKFFYFNYFINVIGAFIAVVIPDVTAKFFEPGTLQFWYNHVYAVFLPILGVALKIFPRPNLKMMKNAVAVFTIYYVFAAIINTWFANFDPSVDYFFMRGDHVLEFFSFAFPLKYNYIYTFNFAGLTWTVYPVYWLALYVGFVLFTFAEWLVYVSLFKVFDDWGLLFNKYQMLKIDMINLKKEMQGKDIFQPLLPKGADMIKIEGFSKKYSGSNRYAVKDFNLQVNAGEVFGFIGHNGAGKSTTIKSLVGIQSITEGKIEICGFDIEKQPLQAKLNVGYVSDNHAVYEKLTGREYINYVADLYLVSNADRQERMYKYTEMFGLQNFIDNEIKSYSHGMKQKIVVIASLIHNPKVWVLDEPLTGLDPTSAWQIKECMKEHAKKGNIVFFSSHVIEVVEKICDRIAIINGGELKGVFNLNELRKQGQSVEKLYLSFVENNETKTWQKRNKCLAE
ncbi:MAG: YwaF family protein [Clostridia bacterium]|nr:YwaF family protein [Clostridia bacterium]